MNLRRRLCARATAAQRSGGTLPRADGAGPVACRHATAHEQLSLFRQGGMSGTTYRPWYVGRRNVSALRLPSGGFATLFSRFFREAATRASVSFPGSRSWFSNRRGSGSFARPPVRPSQRRATCAGSPCTERADAATGRRLFRPAQSQTGHCPPQRLDLPLRIRFPGVTGSTEQRRRYTPKGTAPSTVKRSAAEPGHCLQAIAGQLRRIARSHTRGQQ